MIGEPYDDTEFSGRSDYEAFILAGIPSSGLFTGAEVIKTEEQEAIWGGIAGEQFDQCYHLACDTFATITTARAGRQQRPDRVRDADVRVLDRVGERRARQERAGPPFELPAPAGPEGTFAEDDAGLHAPRAAA